MPSERDWSLQSLLTRTMSALQLRDFDLAHRLCQQCLQRMPHDPVVLHIQGVIYLEQGQLLEAQTWIERAIQEHSQYAQALNSLGVIYERLGHDGKALSYFQSAVQYDPQSPDFWKNLAMVHYRQGKLEETERCLAKGLTLQANHAGLLNGYGLLCTKRKQFDRAQHAYEKVIQVHPEFVEAHYNLAWALEQQNQLSQARAEYQWVLQQQPNYCKAHYALSALTQARPGDSRFLRLEQLKRNSALSLEDQADLYFALAKMYADIGNDDAAFVNYQLGNDAWFEVSEFDAIAHRQSIEKLITATPASVFQNVEGASDSDRPIFIVGMPRSGTTLVEQILASHPEIYGAGELEWLGRLSNHCLAQGETFMLAIQILQPQSRQIYAQEYLKQLNAIEPHAKHVVDKMPDNFLSLWFIAQIFPNAKVIHLRRSPLDNCVACFTTHFFVGHGYTSHLKSLGMYFSDYRRLMHHWMAVLPLDIFELDYEHLVQDQEAQTRRLLSFLGLGWNENCLNFHQHTRSVSTASVTQVRQPMYRSSIDRWKRYEAHLSELIDELTPWLND